MVLMAAPRSFGDDAKSLKRPKSPTSRLVDYFVECTRRNERAVVSRRIPQSNHHDFDLPESVPIFCLPEQMSSHARCLYERQSLFFSFLLTGGDGIRAYGFTVHFWRRNADDKHWTPWALCLISHFPFFSFFKQLLSWMHREIIENAQNQTDQLNQIAQQLTLLQPQFDQNVTTQLEFRLFNKRFFRYQRAASDRLPHIDDFCFRVLFKCLSAKHVVYIVTCMLLEQRILIHSTHVGLLTPICEALQALLFPFTWEHVCVPFLPARLIDYLQAPMPYLIGLHTSSLATPTGCEVFTSCVVVHLDKDQVVLPVCSEENDQPIDFELSGLSNPQVQQLVRRIESVAPGVVHTGAKPEAGKHPTEQVAEESDVELTFCERPLGIVFQSGVPTPSSLSTVVVRGFSRHGGPEDPLGAAEESQLIAPGSVLVSVNDSCVRNLSFNETIDRIRSARLPIKLRFCNDQCLCERGCHLAMTLKRVPIISALHREDKSHLFAWVDTVRSAFVALFAALLQDYERFLTTGTGTGNSDDDLESLLSDQPKRRKPTEMISFDEEAFMHQIHQNGWDMAFFGALIRTQAFSCFISDAMTPGSKAQVFNECIRRWVKTCNVEHVTKFLLRRTLDARNVVLSLPSAHSRHKIVTDGSVKAPTTNQSARNSSSSLVDRSLVRKSSRHFEMLIAGSSRDKSPVVPRDQP